ncbi:FadR/GntR family transcriptional regulator [Cetobacterium sp.]|uniref:FadR/GntR family transcriptional regulator n=1 Tax=Cetobacterium sp. TaxID=2071632 RepID=UPI003AF0472E
MKIVRTLPKEIATLIENDIVLGNLIPEQQIPNEQILMDKFNVSRSTLREAIKILVSKGVLEIHRGKGTFVCNLPGISEDPLGFNFLNIENLNDYIYETREIFEPYACKLIVERASDEEIEALGKIALEMEKLDETLALSTPSEKLITDFYVLDINFHTLICKLTKNPIIERLLPVIIQSIKKSYIPEVFKIKVIDGTRQSTHTDIYLALKNRDGNRASELLLKHLKNKL